MRGKKLEAALREMTDENLYSFIYRNAVMQAAGVPVTDTRWKAISAEERRRGTALTERAYVEAEQHLIARRRKFDARERERREIRGFRAQTAPCGKSPRTLYPLIVSGDSMKGARIFDGDTLWYEKGVFPEKGEIAIVNYFGYVLVKRYWERDGAKVLVSENPAYEDIVISGALDADILGVVRKVEFAC